MQNKQFFFGIVLIMAMLFNSGCANVQWREGSILSSDEIKSTAETATKEQQSSAAEVAPSQRPNRQLTPAPYPTNKSNLESPLAVALRSIVASSQAKSPAAEQALLDLKSQHPDSSGVLYHLGRVSFLNENPAQAITYLQEAIKKAPKNFYAHNLLGLVYRSTGQFDKAQTHYKKALNIWPDYATGWYNLGILEDVYKNNLSAALDAYQNYLAIQTSKTTDTSPEAEKQLELVRLWVSDLTNRVNQ